MDAEKMAFSLNGDVVVPTGAELALAWAKGSRFGKANAEACYNEIIEVADAFGGTPPDGALTEKARDKGSALNGLFDWDEKQAATKWWVHTERQIKSQIVYIKEGTKTSELIQIRAFTNIKETDAEGNSIGVYYDTFDVINDPQKRKKLLTRAMLDMEAFKKRYGLLEELSSVIDPIEAFLDK